MLYSLLTSLLFLKLPRTYIVGNTQHILDWLKGISITLKEIIEKHWEFFKIYQELQLLKVKEEFPPMSSILSKYNVLWVEMHRSDSTEYAQIKEDRSLPLLTATTPTYGYEGLEKFPHDFRRMFQIDIVLKYNTVTWEHSPIKECPWLL